MPKHKMIQHNLFKNSVSAYFAAIELHNKPNISYRYETVSLLLINAWELILKSFIRKYIKDKSIFKDRDHTISIDHAILYAEEHINANIKQHEFTATKENILLLEEYRNNVVHFYNESIEPVVFSLIAKNALDYVGFVKKFFNKDIIDQEGLFIIPLGFKLPFKPEDYFSKKSATYKYSNETKKFIDTVVDVVSDLKKRGIEDSVVLGFNIYFDSVKKITNSDLLAAITSKEEADVKFTQNKKVQITNDPNAIKVSFSEEELFKQYPLVHKDIRDRCKTKYTDCLFNSTFNGIMKEIQGNLELSNGRTLRPKKQGKPDKYIYSEKVFDYLDKFYEIKETQDAG